MRMKEVYQYIKTRDFLAILSFQLMMGVFLGFIFFYNVFYYYAFPFDTQLSAWFILLCYALVGFFVGYLFPDPRIALASSVTLPMLGTFFSFLIFISPLFSKDIISNNISDEMFILARLILTSIFLTFIVIFFTSFMTLYFFDVDIGEEDPFSMDRPDRDM